MTAAPALRDPRPVLENVVRMHVENAAHFWAVWNGLLMADGEAAARPWRQRLEANLHGARLAGETATRIAVETAREFPGPGETFVALRLAIAGGDERAIEAAFALASAEPDTAPGIVAAVSTLPVEALSPHVKQWMVAPDWAARLAAVAACRRHRIDPKAYLKPLLADPSPEVRADVVRLAAALGKDSVALWDDPDPKVRFATALALYRQAGQRVQAAAALRRIAAEPGTEPSLAAEALDRAVPASDPVELRDWINTLWSNPDTARLAISAVAVNGHPGSWRLIISVMDRPETAALATAAAADMLGIEPVEGRFFTADPNRLGPVLGDLADESGTVLADVEAFEQALAHGDLPVAETDPARMSQRARWLARLRQDPGCSD